MFSAWTALQIIFAGILYRARWICYLFESAVMRYLIYRLSPNITLQGMNTNDYHDSLGIECCASTYSPLPAFSEWRLSAHAQATPKAAAPADGPCRKSWSPVRASRVRNSTTWNRRRPSTAETFDQRGYLDVGQALSELPAFGVQPSSAANTQAGFGIAQSFVDLYGLGSQRTLTLVNGRRFVSSSTASLNNANVQ